MKRIGLAVFIVLLIVSSCKLKVEEYQRPDPQKHPNVILIITDDQGYGDLACHGNEWIQTPTMDKLYNESVRLTNFHVGTTCAPTRAGLMSGRDHNRVGVWHTINGRSIMRKEETTIAQIFQNSEYITGMFGKWHLGDNYPYRPQDRGFDEVLMHGGGGVGQSPDYWDNDYFDDVYFKNGYPTQTEGYCTDVWFDAAINFIENNKEKPFFCYVATNAPHSPFHVPQKYIDMYKDNEEIPNPNFYGMITNIDENLALLMQKLEELEIEETGDSFAANACLKASTVAKIMGQWAIADDSGLEVEALNGAPGIYSARYGKTDTDRIARLLQELKGKDNRQARFVCVVAISSPDGSITHQAEGICPGQILNVPRGEKGFGYDPIFYVPETQLTFAQMSSEFKNKISHRGKAFQTLLVSGLNLN
jgi:non-canonical purine NTP pyrophosphatase (RdgB/HAM1 family)